ncbi:MAG: nucleoside monophosphate kinase [Patescibacteria group bacterium]
MTRKVPVYLVFGPQGSGKSTQAQLLADHLKLPFFDSGEQLRSIAHGDGELSENIRAIMLEGRLVSNELLRRIFQNYLSAHNWENGLVIDGFPRTLEQAKLLEELTKQFGWELAVIYVDISDETAKRRLQLRHTVVNGQKVQREDDQPSIVAKRLAVFKQETLPVITWLSKNHRYYHVDGEPDRQAIFKEITSHLNG